MKAFSLLKKAALSILDAVAPPHGRTARTQKRNVADIPLSPTAHDLLGVQITTLMDYRGEESQDLVRSLKYDRSVHAAQLAATLLAEYLREELSSHRTFSQKKICIVPVPLHPSRLRERGFNQIALAAQQLPAEFRDGTLAAYAPDILIRARETKPQTKLPRSERLSNVAGAFELSKDANVRKNLVVLIDDVTTTGATLANAATPLRKAGAEVLLLALARA